MKREFLKPAPENYVWPRCPEADRFVEDTIGKFLFKHRFADKLAHRMHSETSTRFSAWADHIILPAKMVDAESLKDLGFWEDKKVRKSPGTKVYFHPYADLPRLLVNSRAKELGCAVMVEDIWKFQLAQGLTLPIEGAPYSTYRLSRLMDGPSEFLVVERRGGLDMVPDTRDRSVKYLKAFERWATRKRHFDSDTRGMKETLALAQSIAKEVGTGPAGHIFLEGERVYWESRNRAAQVQKSRQDKLGLGWANHDHHTFRSSRAQFSTLIDILSAFGFKIRERYYAGAEAGWGAQVMEQPEAGVIIFADVDLGVDEVKVDFTKSKLPDLEKHRTVGLWCALHGESMLQAGMHHLEAKFDFDQLKSDLKERDVETMAPFSDFPHLRQAFTKAEMWRVPETKLSELKRQGKISDEAYQQIKEKGAVGSHMENLQRKDGFKGFNQRGVSDIIKAVNPEKQALNRQADQGAA